VRLHRGLPVPGRRRRTAAPGRGTEVGIVASGVGRYHVIPGRRLLRRTGLAGGDAVHVAFRLGDPDAVDVPPDLAAAFRDDPGAKAVRDGLTAGTRRGFAHVVKQAKRPETRALRVGEVPAALERDDPSPRGKRL
jgi:Bacteriocin-protection, YdeI or OmpD-Associated